MTDPPLTSEEQEEKERLLEEVILFSQPPPGKRREKGKVTSDACYLNDKGFELCSVCHRVSQRGQGEISIPSSGLVRSMVGMI